MKDNYKQMFKWVSNLVYFLVLGGTFYLSCAMLAVQNQEEILVQTLLYASVLLISIKIGRLGIATISRSKSRVLYTVLVNATGIGIGVILLLLLRWLIPGISAPIIALIVSSVIAFFVLGTICPFFLSDRRINAR